MKRIAREKRNRDIIAKAKDGWTETELARLHGMSQRCINDVLENAGIPRPERGHAKMMRLVREYVAGRADEGASVRDVADELGVTPNALYYHVRVLGLRMPWSEGDPTDWSDGEPA